MDLFLINFQTAGIQTWLFIPPMVAFAISFFTSMAGISGAFLLLPFQVSILGFTGPSVSATNLLYTVAGAVLAANFMTSLVGMAFYSTVPLADGAASPPDFILGLLFGIGGLSGMYMGAKCQNRLPVFTIKLILLAIILMVSLKYIHQYF